MLRAETNSEKSVKAERIAKVIARAGLCSRREAERWISEGRVMLDGKVLDSPAITVTHNNKIVVDGELLPGPEKLKVWRYHKPVGLLTTHKDPEGRPNLFDSLPNDLPRVISIGRLDLTSEGLLLLTNDGELARELELPVNSWLRRYRVRVHGRPDKKTLNDLINGVTIDGVHYKSIQAELDRQQGANAWLTVSLVEGKNREIRRVMEYFGWHVSRLIRTAYGPFQLGALKKGEVDEVRGKVLKEQLGVQDRSGFAEKVQKKSYRSSDTRDKKSNSRKSYRHDKLSKIEPINDPKPSEFCRKSNKGAYKIESSQSANYRRKK
jgi:23S rRNA pseudouridine2605 synthase